MSLQCISRMQNRSNLQFPGGRNHVRILLRVIFKQFNNFRFQFLALFLMISLISGCGSHIYHFVEPGETLYSISWAYGHDYRQVAQWNEISSPYIVKKGQRLRVAPPRSKSAKAKKQQGNNKLHTSKDADKETTSVADKQEVVKFPSQDEFANNATLKWQWPTRGGKVVQTFNERDPGKQGVDVAGKFGQPIYAAAPGRVVYSGGGLSRYGKLIIVKHNETFLSAYAHNKRILVKEGENLKAGQYIAEMGNTGTNKTKLHFEIRRDGKPVNPLRYLPKKMQ